MLPCAIGAFTFGIPLNFPSYTKGFRAETQEEKLQLFPISETRRFKIKISSGAGRNGSVRSYSLNFPSLVRSKYEGDDYLLHKSEGLDVEWPDKPLSCTFICAHKQGTGSDRSINEVVKPPLKKVAVDFGSENFGELVEWGLQVSHGENLNILSNVTDTLFPKAPVAFAFVTESAAIDAPDHVVVRVPALIPLPMNRFAIKANALPPSNVVHISYKASWFVRFVKIGHLCDIFLVFPPPCTAGGQGVLDNFKMEIPSCLKLDVKPYCTDERTFHGVYFIRRSQVFGGAEVRASFQFSVPLFPSTNGIFCFRIPLKFPFYAKGFRPEKQLQPICIKENELISKPRRCKIRIFLSAGVGQTIQKCSLDFPHSVISKSEEHKSLLHMSEGPDVEWPGRPLLYIFICADKQAAGSDSMTDEVVERPQKKMRLPTEAS